MKKIIYITLSLVIFITIYGCNTDKSLPLMTISSNRLNVTILDIGKADAIFIRTRNHTMLIDTGYDKSAKKILKFIKKNKIHKIDYLEITHFDKDHVGGADKILKKIKVLNVLQPDYVGNNKDYKQYIKTLNSLDINALKVTNNKSIIFDRANVTIYPTLQKTFVNKDDNNHSLVTSIKHGKNSFLFAGDAEVQRINELYSQIDLKHTFLKVPHHGIYESNSNKFINDVSPKYAVITCSKKYPADNRILEALEKIGAKTYLTSDGNVSITSNRNTLTVKGYALSN